MNGRLLRWGDSFGLRIAKRDVERLRLAEGAVLTVRLAQEDDHLDLPAWTFASGTHDTSERHDEVLYGEDRSRR